MIRAHKYLQDVLTCLDSGPKTLEQIQQHLNKNVKWFWNLWNQFAIADLLFEIERMGVIVNYINVNDKTKTMYFKKKET